MKQDSLKQDLFKIRTLGELRAAGVEVLPVRLEMRRNLLERLRARERILPGIIGYDQSVLPEIENGVLAGHHMIFLGERGQAKSRLIRLLADLLDERVAAVKGCEINDDPYRPIAAPAGGGRPNSAKGWKSNGSDANGAMPRSWRRPTSRWPI
jgi:hypothetical protein